MTAMTGATPEPQRPSGHPDLAAGSGGGLPFILAVDDSEDMRELLAEVLGTSGYEVVTVGSAARALEVMAGRRPDLVITDLMMPGMNGFTLRALMLRRPQLAQVPVIVLSAYWHRPSETLDVAAVLTKPIDLDQLLHAVRAALGSAAAMADADPTTGSGTVAPEIASPAPETGVIR